MQAADSTQLCAVVHFEVVSEGWQRAVGCAAHPGEVCKPCFQCGPIVLEAEIGMNDSEKLHPCCLSAFKGSALEPARLQQVTWVAVTHPSD